MSTVPKQVDYIVCGGGASGCVVAARLAERSDATVLLLEAGGDERVPDVEDSRVWMKNIGSERDWCFTTEPQPSLNNRRAPLPMGRVLGGGSSINGLVWARGHKADFDSWAEEAGDPGWSYDSVVEVYKRIENWLGPSHPRLRGTGGPVSITLPDNPVPVASTLMDAAGKVGIPAYEDLNAEAMEGPGGCGIPNVTVEDGDRRVSMASAYIRPAMERENLKVILGAEVDHIRFEGTRASAVSFVLDGQEHTVEASREIVLSMGAINTPRVLMQSGIGDEDHLKKHAIDLHQHLPGVGRNFQDHILLAGCVWEYVTPEPPRNNSAEFTFFWKSESSLPSPDIQPMLEECAFGSEVTRPQFDLPDDPATAWTLAPGLVAPKSRGYLELTGKRRQDPIKVHTNFLSEPADMKALTRCLEICREIGNAEDLRPFVKQELMPGPLKGAALEEFVRDAAGTYFHQTCTAKMGRDAMSVVDGALRVYGVDGLRIADGSIMPTITTGNTMAPCVMIGERAVDLILGA
ncbi:GMC family oxidoreductase [Hwanghaeella grinnelliae]|uniref:GMC family oxidoreductase n=1 Tax=Hwanghaeella grinnelliae TaxID=2500179 RepID=A0A3S2WPG0_9PROT|nr:GMC family oxidoreductase N-terminal domain-containing protein [Hwanghaeella grinnelliae]RVU34000.1 GMC family oxidoreductase [Hwanghaeella grinnelliae]